MAMKWEGDAVVKSAHRAMTGALAQSAEMILAKSNEAAPVDEGQLVRSSNVSMKSDGTVATISYNTPYAVRQHEELSYRHKQGGAKYLENPLNENREAAMKYIAAQLKKVM